MEMNDFAWGFAAGLVVATLVGWFWGIYKGWVRQRDAFRKPQAVVHVTPKTPAQVASAAASAQTKIGCAYILGLVFVWAAIELFVPGLAAGIRNIIGNLLFGS
jgi:hypothetical protein